MKTAFLLILSILTLNAIAQDYEHKTALVIGNTNYEVGPLRNPVNDANLLSATLTQLGFDVITKLDTDLSEMKGAVREFQNKISENKGIALFYYSGHGMQVNGTNYLIPVDADVQYEYEVEDEAMEAARVLKMLEYLDNPLNIVILDACRNNPFARSFRSADRGLAQPATAPTGSIVAFSTAPSMVASDGEGSNGLYTQELVKAMLTPDLSIEEVFKYTRINVSQISGEQQIPWENSSLMGSFYFIGEGEEKNIAPIVVPTVVAANEATTKNIEASKMEDFGNGPGNYKSVDIGGKEWLASNLSRRTFSDGSEIKQIKTIAELESNDAFAIPTYIDPNDFESDVDLEAYGKIDGLLYNIHAVVDKRGLCPVGWSAGTENDWTILIQSVDPSWKASRYVKKEAVNKLLANGPEYVGYTIGNNQTGFAIKPTVQVFNSVLIKKSAGYWTSSLETDKEGRTSAWAIHFLDRSKGRGAYMEMLQTPYILLGSPVFMYVRCVKEN